MNNNIQKDEMLYRAVKRSRPDWLDNEKPTSVMFKDENGNSVDRGDNRSVKEIVQFMKDITFGNRLKGVVEVKASDCIDIGASLEAAPSENNPYHANIYIDDGPRGTLQALMLADLSRVAYIDQTVKWVNLQ